MSIKSKSNKFIATLVVLLIMSTVLTPSASGEKSIEFKDLSVNEFGYKEVQYLTQQGIINGFKDHTFRPSLSIKRAEAAKLLVKSLQVQGDGNLPLFKDVSKTSKWVPYIDAAIDYGIFNGFKDGQFGVDHHLTREQMASILVRAYGLKPVPTIDVPLKDLDTSSPFHKEDVKTLYQNGITLGFDDQTFRPKEAVNRITFSVFLHRNLLNQKNIIEDVTANGVVINGELFTFDGTLQGLFTEGNLSALKDAEVEFDTVEKKISKVSKLVLNSSGTPGLLEEFDANVILDLGNSVISGDVIVNGDYVTIKNGTIEGSLTISSNVENDFYMSNVIVKGGTYVKGGDSNTVIFNNSTLLDVVIEKLDVRVVFTNQTSVSTVTVRNNAVIEADSTIIIPLVEIEENVGKVFVKASVTELSLLGNQQVTLEGLTNVGKLTLPSDVKAEDVIANYESIKNIVIPSPDGGSTGEIIPPDVVTPEVMPMYQVFIKDFEDAIENYSFSKTPYYYSSASIDLNLNEIRKEYPTAKTFKVNYFPANQSSEGIVKELSVIEQLDFAYKVLPNLLREFNLNESTLFQFNILVYDQLGIKLGTITHEQIVTVLTADIELAFEGLKADWTSLTFESIRPFIEKSRDMNIREIEIFMKEIRMLDNPSISDINALAEEVILRDLPLRMYTDVTRYIEPLEVGSLLKGFENKGVVSITSKNANMLEVKLGQNPHTLKQSYEFIAHSAGEVDLEVVFNNGNTTETKVIHVEIGILSDTLTEVNNLILEKSNEEISVNIKYLSYVMKHVLETSTELIVSQSFLNHYSYLFKFVSTPSGYTYYDTIEALQDEINQITEEVAPLDAFNRVAPYNNPIPFDATTQKEFDVLGYLQSTEFGVYMSDTRLNYFYIEPSYTLPSGITLESGKLIISDAYVGSETTVTLKTQISFGDYVRHGTVFRVGLK